MKVFKVVGWIRNPMTGIWKKEVRLYLGAKGRKAVIEEYRDRLGLRGIKGAVFDATECQ